MYIYIYIYWVISLVGLVFFFAEQNRYLYSEAARSNYRRYLHVLKYLLFIIRVLKQKGVMQTNRFAHIRETFAVRCPHAYLSASLI